MLNKLGLKQLRIMISLFFFFCFYFSKCSNTLVPLSMQCLSLTKPLRILGRSVPVQRRIQQIVEILLKC